MSTDPEVRVKLLVDILLDVTANWSERDDAAIDLGEFDHPVALWALSQIAEDLNQDETLRATSGESLGEIWARTGRVQPDIFARLPEPARSEAIAVLEAKRPGLLTALGH